MPFLSISACGSKMSWRTNFMIEGTFYGVNEYDKNARFCLEVKKIDKSEYDSASGKNVLEDLIRGGFYFIKFYKISDPENIQYYNFEEFDDIYKGNTSTRISYVDKNSRWLTPYTTSRSKELDVSERYYNILIDREIENIFVNLYEVI